MFGKEGKVELEQSRVKGGAKEKGIRKKEETLILNWNLKKVASFSHINMLLYLK